MRDGRLRIASEFVRRVFFPRWDGKRLWRVRIVRNLSGSVGYCDFTSKVIKVASIPKSDDELAVLLIHEMAHAATASYHDKRWLTRMAKAAQQAKAIGRSGLAMLLLQEIEAYSEVRRETAARGGAVLSVRANYPCHSRKKTG